MQNFGFKDVIARWDEPYRNFGSMDLSNVGEDIIDSNSTISPIDRDKANLEAEKNEIVQMNDGRLFKVLGEPHHKKGTPLNLPEGSFIYSQFKPLAIDKDSKELFKMKEGGKWTKDKNTPAKILQREVDIKHHNKMLSMLDSDNHDNISKNSAKLMLEKNFEKVGQVAYLQEENKGFPQGLPSFAQGTAPQEENTEVMQSKQFMQLGGLLGKAIKNPKVLNDQIRFDNSSRSRESYDDRIKLARYLYDNNLLDEQNKKEYAAYINRLNKNQTGEQTRNWSPKSQKAFAQGLQVPQTQQPIIEDNSLSADGQYRDYIYNNDERQFQTVGINNPTNTYKTRPKFNNLVALEGVGNNTGTFIPQGTNGSSKPNAPRQTTPVNRTNTPQRKTTTPVKTSFDFTAPKPFDDPNAVPPTPDPKKPKGILEDGTGLAIAPWDRKATNTSVKEETKPWEYKDEIKPYTPELYKTFNQKLDEGYAAFNAINTPNFYPVRKQYNFTPLNQERVSERPFLNQIGETTSSYLQNNRLNDPRSFRANNSATFGRMLEEANRTRGQVYNQNIGISNAEAQYNNQGFNTNNRANVDANAQYVDQVNMTDQNAVIEDKMGWNAFTSLRNRNNDLIDKTKMTMASQPTYGTIWEKNGQPIPPALKGKTDEELYRLGYRKTASPLFKLNPRTWNPEYTGAGNINLLGQQGSRFDYSDQINTEMEKLKIPERGRASYAYQRMNQLLKQQ